MKRISSSGDVVASKLEITSPSQTTYTYQVFLSFKGSDAGKIAHRFYDVLTDAGIRVFRDDDGISVGDEIAPEILRVLRAIKESRILVPIFSRNYASSKWCLTELAEMFRSMRASSGKAKILPVFYDVGVDDVKLKTDLYTRALSEYWGKVNSETEQQWKEALRGAGNIMGYERKNYMSDYDLCKSVTQGILINLKEKAKTPDHLVEMDGRVDAVIKLLDIEAPDVRYVGIYGMGGIGKTTLAKVVFDHLSSHFDGCSFLSDIRESSRRDGIRCLQKQLVNDLQSKFQQDISDQDDGVWEIKAGLTKKKVLLVLDDVDKRDHIDKLAGSTSWFATGSRIIITTRDIKVVAAQKEMLRGGVSMQSEEIKVFKMEGLDFPQAFKIFNRHAFGSDFPLEDFLTLSKDLISVVGRLPLALEVIGSYLHGRSRAEWQEKIKELEQIRPENVQQKLMISFETLDYRAQQMFLDIACLFFNRDKTNAIYMWEACDFHPSIGLDELISASLVTIEDNSKLWMHDLLREIGRETVESENLMDPGRRSRLWRHKEAFMILEKAEGTEDVEVMCLSNDEQLTGRYFSNKTFKGLENLRFLEWYRLALVGDFSGLLTKLRWLSWHYSPADFKAINLNLMNLVILDLSWSELSEKWDGWTQIKMGPCLKVLDLTGCKNLTRTPKLSEYTTLEKLILADCKSLIEIDASIGMCRRLKHLNVERCDLLKGLPRELASLDNLEVIFTSVKGPIHSEVVLSFSKDEEIGDSLYEDMKEAGIRIFRADEELCKGHTDIKVFWAINNSKICIPIITKDYFSSARCLTELAYMVESQKELPGQLVIIPIFYDVELPDVKLETDFYTDVLKEHMKKFHSETVGQWEEALRMVAGLPGWKFNAEADSFRKYKKFVVNAILTKLKGSRGNVLAGMQGQEKLFGIQAQAKRLKQVLDVESRDVLLVGIHGIGGIGKTTLAKAVFDQLSTHFEGCSFLRDIQETSKHKGLKYLQDQLLRDINGVDTDYETNSKTRHNFLGKKVLIVLDDVDDRWLIKKLVGKSNRLVSGSRIIVTTRDINVLAVEHETLDGRVLEWPKEVRPFKMEEMSSADALQLFCSHAFQKFDPPYEYQHTCEQVVAALGRLPLALEILGSLVRYTPENKRWKTLKKLGQTDQELHTKLRISYEALDIETKEVFLDIACFFTGTEKATPIYMWDACDLHPEWRIETLISMSFVKVLGDNRLWMHEVVKDFGRKIVCGQVTLDSALGSRFWVNEEVLDILRSTEVNETVQGLRLCYDDFLQNYKLPEGELGSLPNLRFLELSGFPCAVKRDLPNLRWFSWHFCPPDVKATDLYLENVVILDLSNSTYIGDQLGGQLETAKNLKVLNLTSCKSITTTPIFSEGMILERLILEDCENLVEIHSSIGNLKQLMYLNVKGCKSLAKLPDELSLANALTTIVMKGTGQSFNLQKSIVGLTSLTVMEIDDVKIVSPLNIGTRDRLEHLTISECTGIHKLPSSVQCFTSLVKLDLSGSDITQLPDSIGEMTKLEVLNLDCSLISEVPKSIGKLEKLEELHAKKCRHLHGEVPSEIGSLFSLRILDLSFTRISSLPSTMSRLINLQTLNLEFCHKLKKLPELPTSLISLHVMSRKLQNVPDLSKLYNLIDLQLSCVVRKFQADWIGKLSRLEKLELGILVMALDFGVTSQRRPFFVSCRDRGILPRLPSTLSRLCLVHLKKNMKLECLSNLERLISLEFDSCSLSGDGFESLGVVNLQWLEHLSVRKCNFRSVNGPPLPQGLKVLCIKDSELHDGLLDLSRLQNLVHLELMDCQMLIELKGLGKLVSLEEIIIDNCNSLKTLGKLSALQKLKALRICNCDRLKEVKGLGLIKSLKHLEICGCRSLKC